MTSFHILGSRQFGGAEQFFVRLLSALHERGQPVVAVSRPENPATTAVAKIAVEHIQVPLANQWDLWSAWRIRREVERRAPCVVQTYMGRATRLTRLSRSGPAVHVARLGGFYKIDGYYRHAHAWVGNTRGICDYLVRSGMPAARVFQIGNFVPEPIPPVPGFAEEIRARHGIPGDAVIVFALGRLIAKKGFDDLLRAFARLPGEVDGRPLRLLIAGDGPEAQPLKALGDELSLGERVVWLGWQSSEGYYSLADLFVCPSRHEPLGNVILEAWNHRLPVVTTASDGALELVEDGKTGLLAACGDPESLAARLREALAARAEVRRGLGEAGHRTLRARFSRDAVVGAYLDLYGRLLRERGD